MLEQAQFGNQFVDVSAFLPTSIKNNASCCISFKHERLKNFCIALNHEDILHIFNQFSLPSTKEIHSSYCVPVPYNDKYFCTIGNLGIQLYLDEVKLFYQAINELYKSYVFRIKRIEQEWKSNYFDISLTKNTVDVPLLKIDSYLWVLIFDYIKDEEKKSYLSDKSIELTLTCTSSRICVYQNNDLVSIINHKKVYDEYNVVELLTWRPPFECTNNSNIKTFQYWNAVKSFRWLTESLIPTVCFQAGKKEENLLNRFIFKQRRSIDPTTFYRCLRWDFFELLQLKDEKSLCTLLEQLQVFYANYSTKNHQITYALPNAEEYQNICKVINILIPLIENMSYEADYFLVIEVWQSLFNWFDSEGWIEFRQRVRQRSEHSSKECISLREIGCIFDCICCCLRNSIDLQAHQVASIYQLLSPLLNKVYESKILERQFHRVSSC